jgi:hypothetical protein
MLFCQAIIVISNMLMEQGDRDGGDARFLHKCVSVCCDQYAYNSRFV